MNVVIFQRLLGADHEANENIRREIQVLKKLTGHPHIIKFISGSFIDKSKTIHGQSEYLVLTELCTGNFPNIIRSYAENT